MTAFRAHFCYGCTYAGSNEGRTRCLLPHAGHPDIHIQFNAYAALDEEHDFPNRYDPLTIYDCEGFKPIHEVQT